MNVLTLRHHEMVNLMMRALNQNAHEAERLKLGNLVWVIAGHDKPYAFDRVSVRALQPIATSS